MADSVSFEGHQLSRMGHLNNSILRQRKPVVRRHLLFGRSFQRGDIYDSDKFHKNYFSLRRQVTYFAATTPPGPAPTIAIRWILVAGKESIPTEC